VRYFIHLQRAFIEGLHVAKPTEGGCISIGHVPQLHAHTYKPKCATEHQDIDQSDFSHPIPVHAPIIFAADSHVHPIHGRLPNAMKKVKTVRAGQTTKTGCAPNKLPMRQGAHHQQLKAHDST
jgi:hypothetical protein